ncbi:MAG: hypothetical protein E2576_14445 [Alcaligenaceae bacterium]|nr:hypothetical protein [Alcaligenaceae bacterium SAGV5]MPS50420.1 hypothetical protein [Alcaligenaceae bacterium SAGV3]MPT57919.1 hypothetical protein [Alcaligenaceae bacterium]
MHTISLKTSPALLDTLKSAVEKTPTRADLHKQKVSYVFSIMSGSTKITRQEVERLVEQQSGG